MDIDKTISFLLFALSFMLQVYLPEVKPEVRIMHEISLAHQTSHIRILCNRPEWQILYHLPQGITARPEVGIFPFLLLNKHGYNTNRGFTKVFSFSKRQCIPLANMKLHSPSLTKYFSQIFVTLLVQTAARLPYEASRCLPFFLPLLLLKSTSRLRINCASVVAEKTRHNRGKFTECVVEYMNKPRGKG